MKRPGWNGLARYSPDLNLGGYGKGEVTCVGLGTYLDQVYQFFGFDVLILLGF